MALHSKEVDGSRGDSSLSVNPIYAREAEVSEVPKYRMPDGLMAPDTAYQVIHDELMLDGNARLNLATFALNFSRPGAQVVAQYYNFLRLGFEGYRLVQQECRDIATRLSDAITKLGPFELLTDGSELPVFAFKLRDEVKGYSVFDVSRALRERGWLVPAYQFPKNREDLDALRAVIRNGFSQDLADMLLDDLRRVLTQLEKQTNPIREGPAPFHH